MPDEAEQVSYLEVRNSIVAAEGVDLAFWFTFVGYRLAHDSDTRHDLDMASCGLEKMLPGGLGTGYDGLGWEPGLAVGALAQPNWRTPSPPGGHAAGSEQAWQWACAGPAMRAAPCPRACASGLPWPGRRAQHAACTPAGNSPRSPALMGTRVTASRHSGTGSRGPLGAPEAPKCLPRYASREW